ncbi:MAG: saccharopine dehydrogenase C-terminal domain-containing protein [Methanobacteriota archaeon]
MRELTLMSQRTSAHRVTSCPKGTDPMSYRYAVLGAGRQGTAAAYDLAKFGTADEVVLGDVDAGKAKASAARLAKLLGRDVVRATHVDVRDSPSSRAMLDGCDVALSAVPYYFNYELTRIAVDAGVSFVDLGGNTGIVRKQLALDADARHAGVAIVPDCGMGPGLNLTLAVYAMERLDSPVDVFIYDGGLPQAPTPPWGYALTFNVEGLTNEYSGSAAFLRNGKVVNVPALTEFEEIDIPPIGHLEALVTSGGLSTAPWSFAGRLRTLQNKTLRYPGHWSRIVAFRDLGLFDMKPIEVDGCVVVPRHVFHALFEGLVTPKEIRDVCIERARAVGSKDGRPAETRVDLVDRFDEATGFTAMERLTGWHAAIAAEMIARDDIPAGAHSVECGIPATPFVAEARRRGLSIEATFRYLD